MANLYSILRNLAVTFVKKERQTSTAYTHLSGRSLIRNAGGAERKAFCKMADLFIPTLGGNRARGVIRWSTEKKRKNGALDEVSSDVEFSKG